MAKYGFSKVVSDKAFRAAVAKLRRLEKKNTRERDKISALRRKLPMVEMKSEYIFQGPEGEISFLDLFDGKKQLILYHFMYHPKDDSFCTGCSMVGDHIPHLAHLRARDTNLVFASDGPLESIERHRQRMEWTVPWYSVEGSTFNQDLGIDGDREHVLSVFVRDGERIFRTYFTGARGVEYLGTPWSFFDLTPFGRQEKWEKSPKGRPQTDLYSWWKMHDEYQKK